MSRKVASQRAIDNERRVPSPFAGVGSNTLKPERGREEALLLRLTERDLQVEPGARIRVGIGRPRFVSAGVERLSKVAERCLRAKELAR
jgi:hypothetical protein